MLIYGTMVQLQLQMEFRPGVIDGALEALRQVMRSARVQSSCLRAQILADRESPEQVSYVEEWTTEEEMAARVNSADFGKLLALMEVAALLPTLEFRLIAQVRGLEFVEAVRSGRF